jgi:hypothetical protein
MYSCSGEYSTRRARQYSESAEIASREEGADTASLDRARLDSTDLTDWTIILRACSTSLSPLLAPCPLCELAGALCVGAPGRVPCKVEDAKLLRLQMISVDPANVVAPCIRRGHGTCERRFVQRCVRWPCPCCACDSWLDCRVMMASSVATDAVVAAYKS